MSLPIKLPVTARPILTKNVFLSTWNNPTVGKYDFTNVPGNQEQELIKMSGQSVYIFERVCYSNSISEGEFQKSIDPTLSIPQMVFKTEKTNQMIFDRPLPFVNYLDNLELLLFVPSDQEDDKVLISYQSVLKGIPSTLGTLEINCFFQMNVYEVQNQDWIERYYLNVEGATGDMSLRGRAHRSPNCRNDLKGGAFS